MAQNEDPAANGLATTIAAFRRNLPLIMTVLAALGGSSYVAPQFAGSRADEVAASVDVVVEKTAKAVDEHARRLEEVTAAVVQNDAAQNSSLNAVRKDIRDLSIQVEALRLVVARSAGAGTLQRAVDTAGNDEPEFEASPVPVVPNLAPPPRLPSSVAAMKDDGGQP